MINNQPNSEIIIYSTPDKKVSVSVRFEDETAWLTHAQIMPKKQKG